MPGDFGEFSVNIGLGINFLAGGTLFLNSNDTLSYRFYYSHSNILVFLGCMLSQRISAPEIW